MTTSIGPVFFFDQPTRQRRRNKERRTNLDLNGESTREEWQTENNGQCELPSVLPGEAQEEDRPEISSSVFSLKEQDVMDAYKRTAPQLLSELAHVLSQHKWSAEGRVPHGLVNILHYTWQELTAGARLLPAPQHTEKHGKSLASSNIDLSPQPLSTNQKRERDVATCQVKPQVSTSGRVKKRKSRACKDLRSTSLSFSILNQSSSCQDWIMQQHHISCIEDIHLYKWALERLQGAKSPTVSSSEPNKPLLLRHYRDPQPKQSDKSQRTKARLGAFLNGLPRTPSMQPPDPQNQQKLHYRINDGSSIIYYPSGRMAVCQSCSGQPHGGFYSNVFSDSDPPVIIATITAFGHGTAMHPRSSSAISAVWDQGGGLMFDHRSCVTKEWNWSTGFSKRIVIGISDEISLDLFNGIFAILNFKCANERVQLPISALSNSNTVDKMPYLQTNMPFSSDTAHDLLGTRSPILCTDDNGTQPHMVRAVDRPEEAVSVWRREGRAMRELRKIQQRAQCILESWMDFYCIAIGIKCPNMQRMPDVPPRSKLKREVKSAALPSLNSPERTDPGTVPPQDEEGHQRHLSAPGRKNHNLAQKLSRSPQKKRTKEGNPITRIGPVQFYGTIKLESVILPVDPDQQATCVSYPAQLPSSPSAPLTHCPVLLRAALSGDSTQKRCCCSPSTMPLVKDLEYDLFILGQPPHSHQMLIVCVTCQNLYPHAPGRDAPEQLYRRRNKHRMTPCTQSQVDSFRLVRYEISIPKPCYEAQKSLLQQRHNAAPGTVLVSTPPLQMWPQGTLLHCLTSLEGSSDHLKESSCWDEAKTVMYIKGKLLFIGNIDYSDQSCPIKDFEKQISKARGDYRSGLFLPPDFKFRDKIETNEAKDISSSTVRGDEPKKSGLSEVMKNSHVKGTEVTMPLSKKDKQKKTLSTSTLSHSLVHT